MKPLKNLWALTWGTQKQSWVGKSLLNNWCHSWCTYDAFVGVRMTSLPVFRQTFGHHCFCRYFLEINFLRSMNWCIKGWIFGNSFSRVKISLEAKLWPKPWVKFAFIVRCETQSGTFPRRYCRKIYLVIPWRNFHLLDNERQKLIRSVL